ncbi:MAG TPA: hypothetical protein VFR94_04340 [Nitrososphaeraceae archaeon]|nr:hypothetical protein [Nitrososphaeraceae archaeon]
MNAQSIANRFLFSRTETPYGCSWELWTIRWWRWLLSIPKHASPALDPTGELFNLETQDKDCEVIFLPGNLGGSSVRTYVLPSGKALLIPIINFTTSYKEEPFLKTEHDLVCRAKKDIDDIVEKFAEIDGEPIYNLEEYRVSAPPFGTTIIPDNLFNIGHGETTSISDGYWIFLRPLTAGSHKIHTIGSCSSGKTCVDSTLYLKVKAM